jgi:hypothetical protein
MIAGGTLDYRGTTAGLCERISASQALAKSASRPVSRLEQQPKGLGRRCGTQIALVLLGI